MPAQGKSSSKSGTAKKPQVQVGDMKPAQHAKGGGSKKPASSSFRRKNLN